MSESLESTAIQVQTQTPENSAALDQPESEKQLTDLPEADIIQDGLSVEPEGDSNDQKPQASQQKDGSTGQELPFDQFLEDSWHSLMRRDPELLTELGLSAVFGMADDRLNDISAAYQSETYVLYEQILETLYSYDRDSLTSEQRLNYDIYAYYLEDMRRGQPFINDNYPVNHFSVGVQNQLIHFFSNIHPVTDRQSAEDYVTRLSQVDDKFDQLIANMQRSEESGVITPRLILQWSLGDIRQMANSSARVSPFYTSFSEKVNAIDSLTAEKKKALLDQAEAEIDASVIPAFQALAVYLEDLQQRAPNAGGVWQHPNGEAFYDYLVAHYTTTDLTSDEIHQLGYDDLVRIQAEMRLIFDQLGYPAEEGLPMLFDRVEQDGGTLYGDEIVTGYEAIIADAKVRAAQVLDLQPRADVIVIPGPTGGYYVGPAVDGSRPGAFYAAVSGSEPRFGMASLAYHEAIPGHHTQVALAMEMDLPSFRRGSHFTAYVEGWALYAERLMAEIGVYANDPNGDLGRLQMEAFRAARLVVDTGIHSQGWTFDQAVEFMVENTGMEERFLQFEVARYIAWPAQALSYKIGMNEILRLRAKAEDQLGDQFNIREFHNLILGSGALPLTILEQIVDEYIAVNLRS
jgi:uncharacterized protein (DUF885 family)